MSVCADQQDCATVRYLEERLAATERRGEWNNADHVRNLLVAVTGKWEYGMVYR